MARLNFKAAWPEGLPVECEVEDLGDGEIRFSGNDWAIRLRLEPKYARRLASFLHGFADRRTNPPATKGGGP